MWGLQSRALKRESGEDTDNDVPVCPAAFQSVLSIGKSRHGFSLSRTWRSVERQVTEAHQVVIGLSVVTPTLAAILNGRQSKAGSLAQHGPMSSKRLLRSFLCVWSSGVGRARLERWDVTAPIAFVLLGLAAANGPLSVVHLHLRSSAASGSWRR